MRRLGRLTRASLWSGFGASSPQLVLLVVTPFVVAGMGTKDYGTFIFLQAVLAVLVGLCGGLTGSLQTHFAIAAARADRTRDAQLFWLAVASIAALTALALIFTPWIADAVVQVLDVGGARAADVSRAASLLPIAFGLSLMQIVALARLQARSRFAAAAAASVLGSVVFAALVFRSLSAESSVTDLILALTAQAATAGTSALLLNGRDIGRPALMSKKDLRAFLRYCGSVQISSLAAVANNRTDVIVLGWFAPVEAVAFYGLGATIALALRGLPMLALPPIAVELSRAYGSGQRAAAEQVFDRLHRRWNALILPFGGMSAGLSASLLVLWLGDVRSEAAVVATMLAVGYVASLLTATPTLYARAIGDPDVEAISGSTTAALNVLLTVPAAVVAGLYGVVAATTVSNIASWFVVAALAERRMGVSKRELRSGQNLPLAIVLCGLGAATLPAIGQGRQVLGAAVAAAIVAMMAAVWFGRTRMTAQPS